MNITTSLTMNATRQPNLPALEFEGRSYTYRELNAEVNRLANGLVREGLAKGEKVALFMKNSDAYAIAFFAVLKAGGVVVPVNYRLNAEEAGYLFGQSDAVYVFCDSEFETLVSEAKELDDLLHQVIVYPEAAEEAHLGWNEMLEDTDSEPEVEISPEDDAEILYTSGTTGPPKGALFDHQRIVNVSTSFILGTGVNHDDRLLHAAPFFHPSQLNLFLVTGVMLGVPQTIVRDFSEKGVLEAIERDGCTVFFGMPDMYHALLEKPESGTYNLSSIRKCMYGAEPMPPGLVARAMEFFGHQQFYNLCFLTEGGPGGVYLLPSEHAHKEGAGGKSMYMTHVRVVDEEMNDVAMGQVGEFIMRGETIMKSYYNMPEETAEAFRDGWLLTGDLATIDEDGYITLVDRKSDRIISAGNNIYSIEIEQVLKRHPQVQEVATVGIPEEEWGEIVGVVIVPKGEAPIDEASLSEYLLEHLPKHKAPKKFRFAEELPRNASGKILKYQLRELHISEYTWFRYTFVER
ncbi:long-chain-fatty-acid--CoA ligase [Planococcus sp. ISL-109]|uniref:class I adenylate-forming enzyme family protein n=1 Tax=Planococcus sp. ISL-109 TaxID=2819166 RepID=UPI001BE85BC6|nr:long-chain-fatty-acid--CoA ligase [Planococcus sp. ISL-109]MBT2583436.1 long-chain-fatty-acid--CoA ligase [Planococcus sp. ISL-109]